jgi:hypothetical protein
LEVVVLDEDATNAEVAQASAQARKKRKMGRTTGEFSEDALANVGTAMENVGTKLADGMLTAVRALVGARKPAATASQSQEPDSEGVETKFKGLRDEIANDRARVEAQRVEDLARAERQRAEDKVEIKAQNEDLLARIFGKLEELKKN